MVWASCPVGGRATGACPAGGNPVREVQESPPGCGEIEDDTNVCRATRLLLVKCYDIKMV